MNDETLVAQDRAEIAQLIKRQFRSLCWDETSPPDLMALNAAYVEGANLFASARPARGHSAQAFGERMAGLRDDGTIPVFEEKGVGLHIWVAGNVAVAMAGCEMHENRSEITEDISAFLLVKNPDGWAIASQAWDILPSITQAFAATGLSAERFEI